MGMDLFDALVRGDVYDSRMYGARSVKEKGPCVFFLAFFPASQVCNIKGEAGEGVK